MKTLGLLGLSYDLKRPARLLPYARHSNAACGRSASKSVTASKRDTEGIEGVSARIGSNSQCPLDFLVDQRLLIGKTHKSLLCVVRFARRPISPGSLDRILPNSDASDSICQGKQFPNREI
jgi:hypothetical protein